MVKTTTPRVQSELLPQSCKENGALVHQKRVTPVKDFGEQAKAKSTQMARTSEEQRNQ